MSRPKTCRPKTGKSQLKNLLTEMLQKHGDKVPQNFKRALFTDRSISKKSRKTKGSINSPVFGQKVKPADFSKRVFKRVKRKMIQAQFNTVELRANAEQAEADTYGIRQTADTNR